MEKAFIIYGERLCKPEIKNNSLLIPFREGESSALQITAPEKVFKIKERIKNYRAGCGLDATQSHCALMFVWAETCGKLYYRENTLMIPLYTYP